MKPRINSLRNSLTASLVLGISATSAYAAEYTWDTSTASGIQAASGTWGTDAYWTTNGTTLVAWPGSSNSAKFAGTSGTYTVQLSGNQQTTNGSSTVGALNFATDGYTLQSDSGSLTRTITVGTATTAGYITVGSGVTATIGDRVKVTKFSTGGQLDLYGGGTLVIGSGTAGGSASLDTTNGGNSSFINANTTLEVKMGGLATYGSSLGLGNTTAGGGTVKITGGDLKMAGNASNLILNNAASQTATSTVTISNGSIEFTNTANAGGIRFGPSGGSSTGTTDLSGTLNLDGGITTINKIYMGGAYTNGKYTAVVNLNGGTLKALTNNANFFEGITNANNNSTGSGAFVKADGAKFDSNGKTITVGQVLQSGVAGPTLDGGLTLNDTAVTKGTLTLSVVNTYTGATTIKSGTLNITGSTNASSAVAVGGDSTSSKAKLSGSGTINGAVTVKSASGGGEAGIVNAGDATAVNKVGTISMGSTLTFESGSIFEWDLNANKDTDGLDNDLGAAADNGIAGTDFDKVSVTGALSIDSAAIFKVIAGTGATFTDTFWTQNQSWSNIFNVTGTTTSGWSNTAVSVYNTSNVFQDVSTYGSFTITGSTLTWSAVPEPSSALTGLLITAGLLRRRRKA